MNTLRRLLLALYSLVLIAAAGGLVAMAWNPDRKLDLKVRHLNLQAFIASDHPARWVFTAILAGVIVFGLLTLLAALQPSRAGDRGTMRLKQTDGGTVEVTPSALESLLRDAIERLPDVRQAAAVVRLSGGAVESELNVTIEPSASIAHVTTAVTQATSQTLREQVGISSIRRPHIRISYDEINARPAGAGRASRPAPPPEAAETTAPEESSPHD